MTPAEYLSTIVLPTLAELMQAPADQRRAYLACIAAAHLVDHVDVAFGPSAGGKYQIRNKVRAVGPHSATCLAVVEAVCNGTKHAKADPNPNRPVKFAPGGERFVGAFAFDDPDWGLDKGRWDRPGICVDHAGAAWFLDDCVVATVRACAVAFPALLGAVDLGPVVPYLAHLAALNAVAL